MFPIKHHHWASLRLATSWSVSKGARGCVGKEQPSLGRFILFSANSPANTYHLQTSRQHHGLLSYQKKLDAPSFTQEEWERRQFSLLVALSMLSTLQITVVEGAPRHQTIVQLEFLHYFFHCSRRIADTVWYLKLPGMIYSSIWEIVKDGINRHRVWLSSLHNNVNQDDHHWNSEAHHDKTGVGAPSGSLTWSTETNCLTYPPWLFFFTGCAEKRNLTMLGSEANRITHCPLILTVLTDMRWHITQPHSRVAAVPSHAGWQTLPPLSKDTRSPGESSPEPPWLSAQDAEDSCYLRRVSWSLQCLGSDPQWGVMALPSRVPTSLPRVRQTVGSKPRFSHSGFIRVHTTVRALKYYRRSSDCSYRRHCIDQIHYLWFLVSVPHT